MSRKFPAFTEASAQVFLKHHPRVSREEAADAWEKLNSMGVPSDKMYEALDKWFAPITVTPLERKFAEKIGCGEVQDIYSTRDEISVTKMASPLDDFASDNGGGPDL